MDSVNREEVVAELVIKELTTRGVVVERLTTGYWSQEDLRPDVIVVGLTIIP